MPFWSDRIRALTNLQQFMLVMILGNMIILAVEGNYAGAVWCLNTLILYGVNILDEELLGMYRAELNHLTDELNKLIMKLKALNAHSNEADEKEQAGAREDRV